MKQRTLSFPEARKTVNLAVLMDEAQTCLMSGDTVGETAALTALLEVEPGNVSALINLGTAMYNRRSYLDALSLYQRAVAADPGYAMGYFNLGNVLDELRRYPEAIEAYKQALAINPRYEDAHYNLALCYSLMGEKRKAIPHWNRYVRLDPSSTWGERARAEFKRLLKSDTLQIVHGARK